MRELLIIGIGAGNVDHVSVQAVRALARVTSFFVVEKDGPSDLVTIREAILAAHREPGYRTVRLADPPRGRGAAAVAAWRAERTVQWETALRDELGPDEVGAFLVWGDPSLYDSTIDIVEAVLARGNVAFTWSVIAGVSAPHALTAAHRITLNRIGRAVQITTGRRLAASGMPAEADDVVVMLDPDCAFVGLEGVDIFWGAYLGTPDELLLAGPLPDIGPKIVRARAQAREQKGWMFDTYLLRRRLD